MSPPWKVCSKGCNKMLKVPKPGPTPSGIFLTDQDVFDIVVCQVNWRIICADGLTKEEQLRSNNQGVPPRCQTSKSVQPIARCVTENQLDTFLQ